MLDHEVQVNFDSQEIKAIFDKHFPLIWSEVQSPSSHPEITMKIEAFAMAVVNLLIEWCDAQGSSTSLLMQESIRQAALTYMSRELQRYN